MRKKTDSRGFLAAVGVAVFCLLGFCANSAFGEEAVDAPEDDLTLGQVKIEGQYIERLVLYGDGGKKEFDQPGENISVEPGARKSKNEIWPNRRQQQALLWNFLEKKRKKCEDFVTFG